MPHRPLALLAVALLAAAGVVTPAAGVHAQAAPQEACPDLQVPATAFTDTVRSVHRLGIDCAAWWGLTQGRTSTAFAPSATITRGQTAAMVARMLRTTDVAPAEVPDHDFDDVVGHRFEQDIELLASLDIVHGVAPAQFAPEAPVQRAQMASMLTAALTRAYGLALEPGPIPFTDVSTDNVHRDTIGRLTRLGVVAGTSATTFAPRGLVTREQMASFLTRSASVLVAEGAASPPETRPATDDLYASRTRAAWVHLFDDTLKTTAGIRATVDELAAAGAGTIIAQGIRRQDAYYDSDVLPPTPDPGLEPGLDVLDELVAVAHARGLEVHAWWSVAPTWHDEYEGLDAPAGWIATEHGDEAPVADRWVTRTHDGAWSDYLDPGVPAVADHVAAVVGELAANYDVDAVHLDYVRYPSAQHGYNPIALERFRAETGATGTPSPGDRAFSNWRRQQTERLVSRAGEAIEAAGSDARLSAAVISWGDGPPTLDRPGFSRTLSYTRALQDWDRWVRIGLVDTVMPMNYYRAHDPEQAAQFDRWTAYERRLAADADAQVVPGVGGYLNHPAAALAQLHTAMARADGAVVYSHQQPTLDHSRTLLEELAGTRWGYPPA